MSERQKNENDSPEEINLIGRIQTREDMTHLERNLRAKRDVALNTFRQGKLFGSFNRQYRYMRDLCGDSDTAFDSTYSANADYLTRLQKARKDGAQLKDVKEPTVALRDSRLGQFIGKVNTTTGYFISKALSWTSPIVLISDIAGELWDREEFKEIRKMVELTEKQRVRIIEDINAEIAKESRQLQNKTNAAADQKAELKAKKRDEEMARQIREGLGIKPEASNDNNDIGMAA